MDQQGLSGFEQLIPPIAQWLGVEPATVLLVLGLIVTAANLGGRLIPDSAQGFLGVLRKACKVVGLYVGNRVAPGISTNEVAKAVVTQVALNEVEKEASRVVPAFPGIKQSAAELAEEFKKDA